MEDHKQVHKFQRGLYRGVKISVQSLDKIIVCGIVLIAVLIIYGISTGGYQVSYNPKGGSDIPYQEYKYGDSLDLPDPPTREGYDFTGWYQDENCTIPIEQGEEVQGSMTLYAGWTEKEQE